MDLVKETYNRFNGTGMYFALFYTSLLYIYLMDKKKREFMVYPSLAILILTLNPITANIIAEYMIGKEVYWRVFWLLPMTVIIAYVGVHIINNQIDKQNKFKVAIFISLIIMLSGNFIITKSNFQIPENYFKIPNAAIDISLMVQKEKNESKEEIRLATPYEIASTIRQYDATILMLYGREPKQTYVSEIIQLSEQINSLTPDMMTIVNIIRQFNCKYIVLTTDQQPSIVPEELGFVELGRSGKYILYKDTLQTINQ